MSGWPRNFPALFLSQQVPGFAVGVVEDMAQRVVAGCEQQNGVVLSYGNRDDEPAVLGNDVGDYKVNFLGSIRNQASMCATVAIDIVAAVTKRGRAFDLDAPEGDVRLRR